MGYSAIQGIFREHFEEQRRRGGMPLRVLKAARAIGRCRTAELGGHVERCPDGHVERVWYNSCRHRFCPVCAWGAARDWVERRVRTLLSCDYYHTIFTIPDALNTLWTHNRRTFTRLLFLAAWESLAELLADAKYLGALPGAMGTFQSWGQTLWVHPHVHLLVTGGGLTRAGEWRAARQSFLLPSRVLSAKFRGKFVAFLRRALARGELRLPEGVSVTLCESLLRRLSRQKWHVQIMPPYYHGRGVLTYLGYYVRGGPVSDRRVSRLPDGGVCLRYRDETRTQVRSVNFSATEFLDRLLRHVPEEGQHLARVYGLFAPGKRRALEHARALLGQEPLTEPAAPATTSKPQPVFDPPVSAHCPVCGKLMLRLPLAPRERAPPCRTAA